MRRAWGKGRQPARIGRHSDLGLVASRPGRTECCLSLPSMVVHYGQPTLRQGQKIGGRQNAKKEGREKEMIVEGWGEEGQGIKGWQRVGTGCPSAG